MRQSLGIELSLIQKIYSYCLYNKQGLEQKSREVDKQAMWDHMDELMNHHLY